MISKATSVNKKNSLKYDYIFFIKDYFSLVKPKVMTLVVFTAFVGIFVAPVTIHPWIAFISIFCIALGSGAAGAFNMWYETDLDLKMIRTRKRVLPSAKIKKNEALGIAIFFSFISIYVMALTVSYYAAAFLAFSIFFYVVIYTIWLKPRTKNNIVIGEMTVIPLNIALGGQTSTPEINLFPGGGGIIITMKSRPRCARSAPDPPISAPAIHEGFGAPAGRIWSFNDPKQKWFGKNCAPPYGYLSDAK